MRSVAAKLGERAANRRPFRPNGPGERSPGMRPQADSPGPGRPMPPLPDRPREGRPLAKSAPAALQAASHGAPADPDPGYRPTASTLGSVLPACQAGEVPSAKAQCQPTRSRRGGIMRIVKRVRRNPRLVWMVRAVPT